MAETQQPVEKPRYSRDAISKPENREAQKKAIRDARDKGEIPKYDKSKPEGAQILTNKWLNSANYSPKQKEAILQELGLSGIDLEDKANAGKIFDAVKAWQTAKEIDADGTIGWGTLERADQELETKGVSLDAIWSEEYVEDEEEKFNEEQKAADEARAQEAQEKADLDARIDEAVAPEKEEVTAKEATEKSTQADFEKVDWEQKTILWKIKENWTEQKEKAGDVVAKEKLLAPAAEKLKTAEEGKKQKIDAEKVAFDAHTATSAEVQKQNRAVAAAEGLPDTDTDKAAKIAAANAQLNEAIGKDNIAESAWEQAKLETASAENARKIAEENNTEAINNHAEARSILDGLVTEKAKLMGELAEKTLQLEEKREARDNAKEEAEKARQALADKKKQYEEKPYDIPNSD
jgi:hypothetical protein